METSSLKKRRPPVTKLRPLHSLQQPLGGELENPCSGGRADSPLPLVRWSSALPPGSDEETVIEAFVELVDRIVVLDPDEAYCIQDATRGGFILARSARAVVQDENRSVEFVGCLDLDDIPTDFSIGGDKVSLFCGPRRNGDLQAPRRFHMADINVTRPCSFTSTWGPTRHVWLRRLRSCPRLLLRLWDTCWTTSSAACSKVGEDA
jgi:hypothetical protein